MQKQERYNLKHKENSPIGEDRGEVALMHDRKVYTFLSAKKVESISLLVTEVHVR
ncbi:hypothetical protein [Bacillus sp. S3]|uniref:hypothetical protein n=1 Tax=Bacillus sp. S3 TaxID=486398 RepID=UPI00168139EF|nr:hypothetical protein [Bacillus sp. S3]